MDFRWHRHLSTAALLAMSSRATGTLSCSTWHLALVGAQETVLTELQGALEVKITKGRASWGMSLAFPVEAGTGLHGGLLLLWERDASRGNRPGILYTKCARDCWNFDKK